MSECRDVDVVHEELNPEQRATEWWLFINYTFIHTRIPTAPFPMHSSKHASRSGTLSAHARDKPPLSGAATRVHDSTDFHVPIAESRVDAGVSDYNAPFTGFTRNVAGSSTTARLSQAQLTLGDSTFRVELSIAPDGRSRIASEERRSRRTRDAESPVLAAIGESALGAALTVVDGFPLALWRAVAGYRSVEGRDARLRHGRIQCRCRKSHSIYRMRGTVRWRRRK